MRLPVQTSDIQYGDVYWAQVMSYGSGKPRPWLVLAKPTKENPNLVEAIPSSTMLPHTHPERYVQIELPTTKPTSYFKCIHKIMIPVESLNEFITQLNPDQLSEIELTISNCIGPKSRPLTAVPTPPPPPPFPTWGTITAMPVDQQISILTELLNDYGIKTLTSHYGVHHQAIYARINKLGQRMNADKSNTTKTQPQDVVVPVPASAECFDLEADMLGSYIIKLLDPKKKYHIKLREVN